MRYKATSGGKLLLRPSEAAEQLAISRATLYRLIARGAIQTVTVGRARRVPAGELHRFVDGLRRGRETL